MEAEESALACSRQRMAALVQAPSAFGVSAAVPIELVETHISWVLLALIAHQP